MLDKQVPLLQEQVANPPENTAVHQLRARKAITDMTSELRTIKVRPQNNKTFFKLNPAEYEIYSAHKC